MGPCHSPKVGNWVDKLGLLGTLGAFFPSQKTTSQPIAPKPPSEYVVVINGQLESHPLGKPVS